MLTYFDRDGLPITQSEWARMIDDQRRVRRSKVFDAGSPERSFDVSTVWLGIDHSFGAPGAPLIFETMVLAEGSSHDEACERYSTLADARAGHVAMVTTVAAELADPVVMDVEDA